MATAAERVALLRITCPWCGALPGERCYVRTGGWVRSNRRLPITTLDGGCHDARWQAALHRPAPVLGQALPTREPLLTRPW